jgi:hypothetical protein
MKHALKRRRDAGEGIRRRDKEIIKDNLTPCTSYLTPL